MLLWLLVDSWIQANERKTNRPSANLSLCPFGWTAEFKPRNIKTKYSANLSTCPCGWATEFGSNKRQKENPSANLSPCPFGGSVELWPRKEKDKLSANLPPCHLVGSVELWPCKERKRQTFSKPPTMPFRGKRWVMAMQGRKKTNFQQTSHHASLGKPLSSGQRM